MRVLLLIFISILLISCDASLDDARQVKVGMSTCELIYVMGEPYNIEVEPNKEIWAFTYTFKMRGNTLDATIVNDTVVDFRTD